MKAYYLLLLCSLGICNSNWSQTAEIQGILLDDNHNPLASASISSNSGNGTQSNENGFYQLTIPAQQVVEISISHLSFKRIFLKIVLQPEEVYELNLILNPEAEQISEVILTTESDDALRGITTIDPEVIRKIPGANAGIENLLRTLPGVSSNNELSTQYAVRGGNYDENLVYVNGIEIYRPFLIRAGQQEGLSFLNPDLVREIDFSAGGFQAEFGDKLSSVLDITYKRPVAFGASAEFSLLGASAAIEGASSNKRFTAIAGVRYRDNSLLVESQETETNFHPRFFDAQTYLTYQFSSRLEFEFLASASENTYSYRPLTRQTNFGTLTDPLALVIFYSGREEDSYLTTFGALKTSYVLNDNFTAKLIASAYNTRMLE